MTPIMLAVSEVIEQSFMSRLAEQGFTVMLLVAFAVYSLRKIKQLEDKLDKYMSEDREELKEVIIKNTNALERIAGKLVLLLILPMLMTLSCVTKRVTTASTKAISDSVRSELQTSTATGSFTSRTTILKDSVFFAPEQCVADTFTDKDLRPLMDMDGNAVANVLQMTSGAMTGTVTVLPNKSIAFRCRSDSLLMVIRGLAYTRDSAASKYDSVSQALFRSSYEANENSTNKTTYSRYAGLNWFLLVAFGIAIAYIIWSTIKSRYL